jgi:hypothetical protein
MTFDREIAMFIGLLAVCVMLILMVLHLTEVIAATPTIKCQATPPKANTYINWRIIDGRKCYYIGKLKLDKSLLYWEEPEKPLEIEEMPLPTPAPAIRAQSDFENRWQGIINRENLLEPTVMEQWKLMEKPCWRGSHERHE